MSMHTETRDTPNQATTFLLAEHARLCELYLSTRETAERRVTLYLTLTTTIVGVSVALWQLGLQQQQILESALAAALGISLLGLITFHRLLERGMQGTEYLRAINRIHHYFVQHAPEIAPYLFWSPHDNNPRYDMRGVGGAETREVVQLANCLSIAIALGLVVVHLDILLIVPALGVGAIVFVLAYLAHQRYESFVLAREEKRKAALVHFPAPVQKDGMHQMTPEPLKAEK
ncbi:MAG: hypothetical protein HY741_12430 [Chloroflexi bacterium]|nr:hypothetical protein [Chloroflexota bacterium]